MIWTQEYVIAAVAGTPVAGAAAGRLLKNEEDIGAAIVGYYGQAAGDQLTELLNEHIMIAVDLVAAAKSGDQTGLATHDARWTANIESIAAFLAGANPNWPEKDVLDLIALHLKLTKDEAVARITGDWAADVKAFVGVDLRAAIPAACGTGGATVRPSRPGRAASGPARP